jgi:sphinganine-1-phosphate aldolase
MTELAQTRRQLELKLVPLAESLPEGVQYQATLPLEGKGKDWLQDQMERLQKMEKNDVKEGRVSGAVYHVSALWWRCLLFGLMAEMCGREATRSTR